MWIKGRQGTGYMKRLLLQGRRFDCWLIRYQRGQSIPWHVDSVPDGQQHYRFNLVLRGSTTAFECPRAWMTGRFNLFRPDIHVHRVRDTGYRLVLSIGWIINSRS